MALDQFVFNLTDGLLAEFNLGLWIMEVLLFVSSVFLMLLVLVQRGKGGGLTGALGGMGGQSAFGSKAGDAFTKITVITAMIWLMLCMITIARFNPPPAAKTTADESSFMGIDDETKDGVEKSSDDEGAAILEKALNEVAEDAASDASKLGEETTDSTKVDSTSTETTPKNETPDENKSTEPPKSGDGN
jgi:preprotein translocase subunit SecG